MKKYQLPKEFAEKWVKALRSGEYKQCVKRLYNQNKKSYCCLGVSCEIMGVDKKDMIKNNGCMLTVPFFKEQTTLPDELTTNFDLNNDLVNLNDSGKTFLEISDWLTENVEFI